MPSHSPTVVSFLDGQDQGECLVAVRVAGSHIALSLSRREDGDIEVLMPPNDARKVLAALTAAIAAA